MTSKPEELEFGNFKILRRDTGELWELGRGGFGTTYKAEHTHLMRECALKVINDSRVASEDARRRFLQEARAAASLLHPHIAAVYDFGEAEGTFYYAMEYCAGGDLEKFATRKGSLSWSEVEPLAIQIASALSVAHRSGLLHRDLKPSNVMLSSENQPNPQLKLIDFGLVKVLDHEKTSSTQVMLTQEGAAGFNPLTASPEQLRDEDLDERSDLFSFGVTLLYLLCGGVPFGSVSAPLMMAQRLDDESYDSILPKDLTGVGREVISRLIQKDRERRFRTADDVLAAIQSATHVVTPSHDAPPTSAPQDVSETISDETPQDVDWASAWEVKQIQQKCHSGSYYRCAGRQKGIPDVVMFMPSAESPHSDTILSYADKLVDATTGTLLSFTDAGYMDGERAYLCQPFMREGGRLLQLLQAQGNFSLQTHLGIFQQLSQAIDEATKLGLPGLELNAAMIVVDEGEISKDGIPESPDEWLDYYKKQISKNGSFARAVGLSILPKLEDPADDDDVQATVTLEDLATDPITKFGSLIYRSISGMSVRPAAYLRESGYVSTSNLGEESNRFLAEIIAGRSDVSSATEIITRLCEYEGVSWDVGVLEGHLSTRRDESQLFTTKIAGVGKLMTEALEAEQRQRREREERERREAKEREEQRVAEEQARAAAAAEELLRKEQEAKAAAEAEKLRLEEEARQKKEEEKKAAAAEKKAAAAKKKAAKLKKEQDKRDAEARASESKSDRQKREKREEQERIAAEKEKVKQQEAEASAAAALKLAQEKEQKQKQEQAEREQQKIEEEQRKADEANRKAEEEKRKLAEAQKETERVQEDALAAQKLAEKEKKEVEQGREKLTPQQLAVTVKSKKKPIIIAAAALVVALLAFVGIKAFTGGDDDGGGGKSGTTTVSTAGNGNSNTKDPNDKPEIKPTPVPKRTECVVIIPLSDGGEGIPDDAHMALYSGPVRYGDLIKESGVLKATIAEASPPKGENFEVKFKNKNYTLESNITLKSEHFREAEAGVFKYKGSVSLNAHAELSFSPSLASGFTQYRKPLFELLKIRDHMKVLNAQGGMINGAKASYDESSGKINITMPTGWSFDGKNAELKIDWPYFEALSIKIGKDGLPSNEPWVIKLKKYNLDLSTLKAKMPRFSKVTFMPKPAMGINDELTRLISDLLEQGGKTYSKNYQDIKTDKDVLVVPSQQGDLYISGGAIHEQGLFFKGAVKRGRLIASFEGFPKGIYFAAQPIPYQFEKEDGGYLYKTVPSIVTIHLNDQAGGSSDASQPFEFRVMIEANLKMATFLTQLKLKSWDQRKNQWTLTNASGKQQALNLILIVSKTQNGTLNVDYTDIAVNGSSPYNVDAIARSKWGLSLEEKEDGLVYQKLKMSFNFGSDNAQTFIKDFEKNFLSTKQDFENLKTSYQLPPEYPEYTKALFEKLGGTN